MSNSFGEKNFQETVSELRSLNPKAFIMANANSDGIISRRPADKLNLPRDFYVTRNNSLSNRGNTQSGDYLLIGVEVKNAELSQKPKLRFLDKVKLGVFKLKTQAQIVNKSDREM